ncbi:MAG: bifunctional protein FolC [Lachnospiraceae bacterium]|nr:bifunctional protein FolC [Lachnospiraceae bacterium]
MNRQEAEDYIYKSYLKAKNNQDYNAKDSLKRRPDLTRTLIQERDNTPSVVVTGSKGKGSVANMLSQILQTNYKVGLMTSPHLVDFCERFKVNGVNISDEDFVKCIEKIKPEVDAIDAGISEDVCISPMGIQSLLALEYFNEKKTDFNIFECGKGARYDDVNNISHKYAVINTIFLEHTRELGESLSEIAIDKSHVITGQEDCVYVAEQDLEVMEVILDRAKKLSVDVKHYGKDFYAQNICYTAEGMKFDVVVGDRIFEDIIIPLMGAHQAKNCALTMACAYNILGDIDIAEAKKYLQNIYWPGRMEVISSKPWVMLDACINSASCDNVIDVLEHLTDVFIDVESSLNKSGSVNLTEKAYSTEILKPTVIIGIPDDKDYLGVAKKIRDFANKIILTKSQNPHYIFTIKQQEMLAQENIETIWTESIEEAVSLAKEDNAPIIILGTTSLVAEVKKLQSKLFG